MNFLELIPKKLHIRKLGHQIFIETDIQWRHIILQINNELLLAVHLISLI